jgi:hypothetical protein
MPYTSSAHLAAPRSPRDDTVYICVLMQNTNTTKPTPHFQAFPLPPGELSPAPPPSPDYSWKHGHVLRDEQGDIFTAHKARWWSWESKCLMQVAPTSSTGSATYVPVQSWTNIKRRWIGALLTTWSGGREGTGSWS